MKFGMHLETINAHTKTLFERSLTWILSIMAKIRGFAFCSKFFPWSRARNYFILANCTWAHLSSRIVFFLSPVF
jgi:hypothetical protein